VRIVVLEDEPLYRDLLVRGLNALTDIEVTGAYGDGPALLLDLQNATPQAAILDLVLQPGASPVDRKGGIQVGLALRDIFPGIGIVLLSNFADPRVLTRIPAEESAGWAYLLKRSTTDLTTVEQALHAVVQGSTMVDPEILQNLTAPTPANPDISAHALRVLAAVASGASNAVIAEDLGVTVRSVENTISALLKSLDIDTKSGQVNARVSLTLAYLAMAGSPRR
jgi:DNA-binding NarL/FixJ family response regulator